MSKRIYLVGQSPEPQINTGFGSAGQREEVRCKITRVHENQRFPGVTYAELRDLNDDTLLISATLPYIFTALRARPELYCINVTQDRFGNYELNF